MSSDPTPMTTTIDTDHSVAHEYRVPIIDIVFRFSYSKHGQQMISPTSARDRDLWNVNAYVTIEGRSSECITAIVANPSHQMSFKLLDRLFTSLSDGTRKQIELAEEEYCA